MHVCGKLFMKVLVILSTLELLILGRDDKLQLKQHKLKIIEDRAASRQRAPATLPHTIKMRLQFAPAAA